MLPTTHAQENGLLMPHPQASRFLNARIAPSHMATDSEQFDISICSTKSKSSGAWGIGFNRRVSISVLEHNDQNIQQLSSTEIDGTCGWD
jgi:hypothetical protein